MKAIQKQGTGRAAYAELPIPQCGPKDLLLKPLYSGICATDLHVLYHDLGQGDKPFPVVMGHEFSAVVAEVGSEVDGYIEGGTKIEAGHRVTVEPILPCGKCEYCHRGKVNLCPNMSHLGIYENGCYADFVSVPANRVHRLPDNLPDLAGALVEPLACAINFVDKARIQPGNSVVILGGGSIAQLTLQVALASGAGTVIVTDPVAKKRELALKIGAHAAIDPMREDVVSRVRELTGGGADIVIECVGVAATVSQMVQLVHRGGRCVMAGIPTGKIPMDLLDLVFGEIELVGVMATVWQFPRAMRMIELGRVDVRVALDKVVPFSQAIEGLKEAFESSEVGKVVIQHGA
ncbi:zinc-dependent alcohol dehydrogenase [Paenibacillus humicola]|uniref:zinc-dependent alcohol dehydrogenase n=1 Tax=Paenibacillus humicola TaxID=3110540 RepID=UPI00237B5D01|nr:zinc-binding dehydrogenase [Paenibacillus humicola]